MSKKCPRFRGVILLTNVLRYWKVVGNGVAVSNSSICFQSNLLSVRLQEKRLFRSRSDGRAFVLESRIMGRTASPKRGWGPRVQPLTPSLNGLPAQYLFLIWVVGRSRGGAARRTGGMAWREGREWFCSDAVALRFNLSEAIAERNAFNCECERHDLLACKMQGHDVCFAAVTRLRTFIKAIECAAVVYGGHE